MPRFRRHGSRSAASGSGLGVASTSTVEPFEDWYDEVVEEVRERFVGGAGDLEELAASPGLLPYLVNVRHRGDAIARSGHEQGVDRMPVEHGQSVELVGVHLEKSRQSAESRLDEDFGKPGGVFTPDVQDGGESRA